MLQRYAKSITVTLKFIFILGTCTFFLNYKSNVPRILVVHSYNVDYGWVRQVNEGLHRVFKKQSNFTLHWQYMDTKEHPTFGYKQKAGLIVRNLIKYLQPTIIIAVDDDAQELVAKFYIDDPSVSIVFCGLNGDPKDYSYEQAKNVTGVLERLPLEGVKNIIPYLVLSNVDQRSIRVINLGDVSNIVKLDEKSILNYNWAPLNLVDSVLVSNFDDWKRAVIESNKRADCIYITNYRQIEDKPGSGKFVTPSEIIDWTEKNSRIPILGGNGFIVEDGGSIALAASAYEQGEVAAQYALEILNGVNPSMLPIVATKQYLVFMRQRPERHFDRLPGYYEMLARSIDKYFKSASTN